MSRSGYILVSKIDATEDQKEELQFKLDNALEYADVSPFWSQEDLPCGLFFNFDQGIMTEEQDAIYKIFNTIFDDPE